MFPVGLSVVAGVGGCAGHAISVRLHRSSVTDTDEVTLSVNYDATDLSTTTTPSAGTSRQICRDLRHGIDVDEGRAAKVFGRS